MDWYYVDNGKQAGPVSEADFLAMVESGKITPDTLVWKKGMPQWIPHREVAKQDSPTPATTLPAPPGDSSPGEATAEVATGGRVICSQCGTPTAATDAIQYGATWVCAICKPAFVQKLKEGVGTTGSHRYAGFWIRFVAKFVDGVIMWLLNIPVSLAMGIPLLPWGPQPEFNLGVFAISFIASISISGFYSVFLIGRYGATLGKMACRVKVITADGGRVSYPRAIGRFFADILSGCPTLMIGYIIAAFDDEKRALHDHICNTRVVYKD